MSKPIRIYIVDDHTIFRDGLKFIISQINDFEFIGESENGEEFLSAIEQQTVDIVLMDISMPIIDGIEATRAVLEKIPELKIITLSSYGQEVYYYKMIKAGAQGFIQKDAGKTELEKAIRTVYQGDSYFPSNILRNILLSVKNNENDKSQELIKISDREKQVLLLICQGLSNNQIAKELFISPKTVDNHRTSLLSKTQTKNAANLVMFAIKNKLIEV